MDRQLGFLEARLGEKLDAFEANVDNPILFFRRREKGKMSVDWLPVYVRSSKRRSYLRSTLAAVRATRAGLAENSKGAEGNKAKEAGTADGVRLVVALVGAAASVGGSGDGSGSEGGDDSGVLHIRGWENDSRGAKRRE